jgi:hypothetical protein
LSLLDFFWSYWRIVRYKVPYYVVSSCILLLHPTWVQKLPLALSSQILSDMFISQRQRSSYTPIQYCRKLIALYTNRILIFMF